jgi:predicted ABC-class ATPase
MTMKTNLSDQLYRLDGQGYGAYKSLKGAYDFGDFTLHIDHVQGDPFAGPSRVRVVVPQKMAGFPNRLWEVPCRAVALADYLTRGFAARLRPVSAAQARAKAV